MIDSRTGPGAATEFPVAEEVKANHGSLCYLACYRRRISVQSDYAKGICAISSEVQVPMIALNIGVKMPRLGFGVWQIVPDEFATATVRTAVDAATIYTNEGGVGAAIEASGPTPRTS